MTSVELDEWGEIRRLEMEAQARIVKWIAWPVIGMIFVAASLAIIIGDRERDGYNPLGALLIGLMLAAFYAIFVVIGAGYVADWATGLVYGRQRQAYLVQIAYAQRYKDYERRRASELQRRASRLQSTPYHDADSGGRAYPVTDGQYDPDLYRQRGGYATYRGMAAMGIDDYQTYKNNVLEAD